METPKHLVFAFSTLSRTTEITNVADNQAGIYKKKTDADCKRLKSKLKESDLARLHG